MENSSKALVMAGGVFIAIAVISLALYAYGTFRGYVDSSEQLLSISQVESFNRFYESYVNGTPVSSIRGVDVVNIYYKALDDGFSTSDILTTNFSIDAIKNNSLTFIEPFSYRLDYNPTNGKISRITLTKD